MNTEQIPHLVFGGEVKDPQTLEFADFNKVHIIGIFPNYQSAELAWRGASMAHIDDAMTKYVIVHLHRLLQPE